MLTKLRNLPLIFRTQTLDAAPWSEAAAAIVTQLVAESREAMKTDGVDPKRLREVNAQLARQRTPAAREKLVLYNVMFALQAVGAYLASGIDHEELISRALESTMMAAKTWNPDHPGAKQFAGYVAAYVSSQLRTPLKEVQRRRAHICSLEIEQCSDPGCLADKAEGPEDWIKQYVDRAAVEHCLSVLKPRFAALVRERYGINEIRSPRTQEDLAKQENVSKQRIRDILNESIAQLKLKRGRYAEEYVTR